MKVGRLALVTVAVLGLLAIAALWSGRSEPVESQVQRPPVPAVRADGELGSTWYCAAGSAKVQTAHALLLSNPTASAVRARLTGYVATGPTTSVEIEVPANGPLVVDVAPTLGDASASVLIESAEPELAVDHQLVAEDGGGERSACATSTSGAWHFPALTTTRDAGAYLTLFNPFPGDAGVDVAIGVDTGTRVPTALTGVVVPAGTAKVIDLGGQGIAERREQFTAVVRSRSGRVVAEVAQSFDGSLGPTGLRTSLGVPSPQRSWAFAGGFTGTGAAERLVVQNPGEERARVLVQVTPYGGAANPPEPLEVEVEPGRYVVSDLSAETRIPGIGYHSIELESDHPVVVARTTAISGGPDPAPDPSIVLRPALTKGVAVSTGTSVASREWVVPSIDAGVDPAPVVLVHNPGEGIARVTFSILGAGQVGEPAELAGIEVAPGDSVAVPLGPASAPEVAVRLRSTEPVVVERITVFPAHDDLAFDIAVPVHRARSQLSEIHSG